MIDKRMARSTGNKIDGRFESLLPAPSEQRDEEWKIYLRRCPLATSMPLPLNDCLVLELNRRHVNHIPPLCIFNVRACLPACVRACVIVLWLNRNLLLLLASLAIFTYCAILNNNTIKSKRYTDCGKCLATFPIK